MSTRDSDTRRFFMRRLLPTLLVAVAIGTAWGVAGAQQEGAAPAEGGVQVGAYEPQDAFLSYHRTQQFQQEMQQMQDEVAEDPQRAAQLQQVLQQRHEQLVQQFQQDVEASARQVAEERQMALIVIGVTYSAPQVQVSDVTEAVVEKLNEGAEAPEQDLSDFLQP